VDCDRRVNAVEFQTETLPRVAIALDASLLNDSGQRIVGLLGFVLAAVIGGSSRNKSVPITTLPVAIALPVYSTSADVTIFRQNTDEMERSMATGSSRVKLLPIGSRQPTVPQPTDAALVPRAVYLPIS
jgi:hypothetical protein